MPELCSCHAIEETVVTCDRPCDKRPESGSILPLDDLEQVRNGLVTGDYEASGVHLRLALDLVETAIARTKEWQQAEVDAAHWMGRAHVAELTLERLERRA